MIPINPLTLMINGMKIRSALNELVNNHLMPSGYDIIETSGYRDEQKNTEVGGASDSAHMYNLAKDIVITYQNVALSPVQMSEVYDEKIEPYWKGFSLFEGDHIHLNLDREESKGSSAIAWTGLGAIGVGYIAYTQIGKT